MQIKRLNLLSEFPPFDASQRHLGFSPGVFRESRRDESSRIGVVDREQGTLPVPARTQGEQSERRSGST